MLNTPCPPRQEEANRQLTRRLARWHFVLTERNQNALLTEGLAEGEILVTGNAVLVVGTESSVIRDSAQDLLDDVVLQRRMPQVHNPYANSKAFNRIVEFLKQQ